MLYHDISDDYKSRDYLVEYTLQKERFTGHIYLNYNCNGFGLTESVYTDFQIIYTYAYIENDCEFKVDYDKENISFTLTDNEGNKIFIEERAEGLAKYLVGINMISCEGHGNKKERRKCSSCKNLDIIPDDKTIKGYCKKRKSLGIIYGSRIICAFDYESNE